LVLWRATNNLFKKRREIDQIIPEINIKTTHIFTVVLSTQLTDTQNNRVSHKNVLKWTEWIVSKISGCPLWKEILEILIHLTSYIVNFM